MVRLFSYWVIRETVIEYRASDKVMNFFKASPLTPNQIARRKEIQAKGRRHFILYRGVLGWGVPMLFITTALRWYRTYRWHLPPQAEVWFDILLGLVIWPLGGYWFGARMWRRFTDQIPS